MRRLIAIMLLSCLAPAIALAQDRAEAGDRGLLTSLLESVLSEEGREVRIDGFEGAVASQASIEQLTVADDVGVWLTLRGVVLDWERAALLRGRIEVTTLTAKEILLQRLPSTESDPWSPAALELRLPELPVSVRIDELKGESVILGKSILGQDVALRVEGAMSLANGAGSIGLSIERTDDIAGSWNINSAYDNDTQRLSVDLHLSEGEGGLIAGLLNLPGQPATGLSVEGAGPISGFSADIRLSTDGQDRLAGQVSLRSAPETDSNASPPTRLFEARVSGDITPLFAPEYRSFFGPHVALMISAWKNPDGELIVKELSLETQVLTLSGSARIAPDGWPSAFRLTGTLVERSGHSVLLPFGSPKAWIDNATLELSFDAAQGDAWNLTVDTTGARRQDVQVGKLRLAGTGRISRTTASSAGNITANIEFIADELDFSNEARRQAIGDSLTGVLVGAWKRGQPMRIDQFSLAGANYRASGGVTIAGLSDLVEVAGRILLESEDLSRFAKLSGRNLKGAARLQLAGWLKPLGGSFDLDISGSTTDLALGHAELDRILPGPATIDISARRDTHGLMVRKLKISSAGAVIEAACFLSPDSGQVELEAQLRNIGVFINGLNGPVSAKVSAERKGESWFVMSEAEGPGGMLLRGEGMIDNAGDADGLYLTGMAPLAIANYFIQPRSMTGNAELDLTLDGPFALSSLSGRVSTGSLRWSDPDLLLAIENLEAEANIARGTVEFTANGTFSTGGTLSVTGPVQLTAPYQADLSLTLHDASFINPALYSVQLSALIDINGPLAGGADITGRIELGTTEVRLPATGASRFSSVPDVLHQNEPGAVNATRRRAGLVSAPSGNGLDLQPYGLDVVVDAPARIFLHGRGLDAELGGTLRLLGTTADIVPEGAFDLIRGWLDIPGKRLVLSEGTARIQGDFVPYIRLVATADTGEVTVSVIIEGRADSLEVTFASQPELPEDEVLAQLLFSRSVENISPLQAAQIAEAAANLAGGGDGGVVHRLRRTFGLDDLDATTDPEGETSLRAGKYLSERLYSQVEVDSDGVTDINLNLDLNRSVTIKGGVGSQGKTSVGIFFERDY